MNFHCGINTNTLKTTNIFMSVGLEEMIRVLHYIMI